MVLTGEARFPVRYAVTHRDERLPDVIGAGGVTDAAYVSGAQFYRVDGRAGRVGIDLERVLRDSRYRDNLILFAGDSLHVPQYQPIVLQVEGAVNSPVAVAHRPRAGVGYYVNAAGGFSRRTDGKRMYVVQPDGAVTRADRRPEPGGARRGAGGTGGRAEDELGAGVRWCRLVRDRRAGDRRAGEAAVAPRAP